MSLTIIKLLPQEINLLLEEKILPQTLNCQLRKGINYGFYCHRHLYGLYRVKIISKKYYYLSKNHYRPLKLFWGSEVIKKFLTQTDQVKAAWKARNSLHGHLLMTNEENDVGYSFTFHHHLLPVFKKTLTMNKTRETQELITKSLQILSTFNSPPLSELQEVGGRLFQLAGFEEILPLISHRVIYATPPPFPLEVMYYPKYREWVWIENPIHYFHKPILTRRRLHRFALFSTQEDSFMMEEADTIKRVFKYKNNFSAQFLAGRQKQMLREAMNSDTLHLIAHGKVKSDNEFHFLLHREDKKGSSFTLKDIACIPQTPALVFLSNCYSNHPYLREIFFKRGTQTLITSQGPLFSSNLARVVGDFYRRLLNEKMTVLESYHLMIKKLAYLNDINAVKFCLHGYGQERLYSFKK